MTRWRGLLASPRSSTADAGSPAAGPAVAAALVAVGLGLWLWVVVPTSVITDPHPAPIAHGLAVVARAATDATSPTGSPPVDRSPVRTALALVDHPRNQPMTTPIPGMSCAEVHRHLVDGDAILLDASGTVLYAAGHIPGAWDAEAVALAALLPADRAIPVIVYGRGPRCPKAAALAGMARDRGHGRVFLYDGGLALWKSRRPIARNQP